MFVVFEGIDGSGKSTVIKELDKFLSSKKRNSIITAEPQRHSIITEEVSPKEKAYIYARDRYEHIYGPDGINEFLSQGKDVICDRYVPSHFAYQGNSALLNQYIEILNRPFPCPDILFFMDVDFDVAVRRIKKRCHLDDSQIDKESLSKALINYRRMLCVPCRKRPKYRLDGTKIYVIDANQTKKAVVAEVTGLMDMAINYSIDRSYRVA